MISTYVRRTDTPTIVTHLMLRPVGHTATVHTAEHAHEHLDPVESARECAYDNAHQLIELLSATGREVRVRLDDQRLDDQSFTELERAEWRARAAVVMGRCRDRSVQRRVDVCAGRGPRPPTSWRAIRACPRSGIAPAPGGATTRGSASWPPPSQPTHTSGRRSTPRPMAFCSATSRRRGSSADSFNPRDFTV